MIRRDPIQTRIHHERWLVSYSDFITLLFAFFVVMYSVSQINETKYRTLSETLGDTFSRKRPQKTTDVADNTQLAAGVAALQDVSQVLQKSFTGLLDSGQLTLSGNEQWVELAIDAELIFASSSAVPSDAAIKLFADIADILAPIENAVAVSGHTDNIPIDNASFRNNWELSAARAVSVVNLLAFGGVQPQRLSAIGYGEYHPVADNATAQGRAANRRVVLRVAKEVAPASKVVPAQLAPESTENEINSDINPTAMDANPALVASPAIEQSVPTPLPSPAITPIKLKNGGLLFTNDPDSPAARGRKQ